jgi:RES domain-containing protein
MTSIQQVNLKQRIWGMRRAAPPDGRGADRKPGRAGAAFHVAIYSSRMAPTACDKASPIAFIALHTCAAYVSKAAI